MEPRRERSEAPVNVESSRPKTRYIDTRCGRMLRPVQVSGNTVEINKACHCTFKCTSNLDDQSCGYGGTECLSNQNLCSTQHLLISTIIGLAFNLYHSILNVMKRSAVDDTHLSSTIAHYTLRRPRRPVVLFQRTWILLLCASFASASSYGHSAYRHGNNVRERYEEVLADRYDFNRDFDHLHKAGTDHLR